MCVLDCALASSGLLSAPYGVSILLHGMWGAHFTTTAVDTVERAPDRTLSDERFQGVADPFRELEGT